jgi:DUF1365 family protein
VHHRRTVPFTYAFTHATTMWLVDVADPNAAFPRWLRGLARIRSRDHLAEDDRPIAEKVGEFLDAQDLPWTAHRVLMLTNARSLGYVFDPLTTYFSLDRDGRLEGVLAEVHNTYGERHCYPLPATGMSQASVGKTFYVSPFLPVDGRYDVRTRLTDDDVAVAITLTQGGRTVFSASVHGDLATAGGWVTAGAVARDPLPSQRVSALIRWHGIRLWLRRLPVVSRPSHQAPKGMA